MRDRNLTEPISDGDISRIIRYLDPDYQKRNSGMSEGSGFESALMLILLLGGVIACFVALLLRVAE